MIVVPSPDYRVQFRSACAGHADRYHFFKGKAVSAGLCAHRYWPLYGKTRHLGKSLEHLYNIIHNPNNPMHMVGYDEYAQSGMEGNGRGCPNAHSIWRLFTTPSAFDI